MNAKLVLIRHAESEWNAKGLWTGTTNVHLTAKGHQEAERLGQEIKDLKFDQALASEFVRTHETLEGILKGSGQQSVPCHYVSAFNERDYGEFTGKNKWEVKDSVGEEIFKQIRRSWDYEVPGGESLKAVYERTVPYYLEHVLPLLKQNRNILIVAHGNTIRALQKYIESISDEDIAEVEMHFGTILIYEVNEKGLMKHKSIKTIDIVAPPA